MPAWPSSELPAPQWDGLQIEMQDTILRSQMDTGHAKTRRRFTAASTYIQATWVFTRAQFVRFMTFYESETYSGALAFDWVHPVTNATVQARFRKPPTSKTLGDPHLGVGTSSGASSVKGVLPRPSESAGAITRLESLWQVSGELEVLP